MMNLTPIINRLSKSLCGIHTKIVPNSTAKLDDPSNSTVDYGDIERHAKFAGDWWNPSGPMKALHSMNQIRVPFIRDGLIGLGITDPAHRNTSASLNGLHLLEVGCGAGILTEQLARINATMTSIDPGTDVINAAQKHLQTDQTLAARVRYRCEPIELHVAENQCKYDAVVVSEVLEHVRDKVAFLGHCLDTLKPGGSIFITTFNKTCFSWLGSIVVAEQLVGLVPAGTHNWDQFIPPIDTQRILSEYNCSTILVNGFIYEFWKDKWLWTDSTKMSYALHAVKQT